MWPLVPISYLCAFCYKDKIAAKEKEREQRIAEAELENVHSARNIEAEKLKEILAAKGLSVKEVLLKICYFVIKKTVICATEI